MINYWLAAFAILGALLFLYFRSRSKTEPSIEPPVSNDDADAWKAVFEQRAASVPYRAPASPSGIVFTVSVDPQDDYFGDAVADPVLSRGEDDMDVKIDLDNAGARAAGGTFDKRARDTVVGIKYVDARGVETVRDIAVWQFNNFYLGAWCFERQRPRTFRWDRISAAFDAKTGEIIPDLRAMLRDIADQSETWKPLWPIVRRGLRILAYIAHCDGSVHTAERDVMRSYIRSALAASKDSPAVNDETLTALVRQTERTLPHPDSLQESLDAIVTHERQSQRYRIIAEHALQLVEADGTITPEEQAMVSGLRDWLSRMEVKKAAKSKRAKLPKAA